ncbi:MAG: tetratricopeptide repeat protein [Treponema sp.]|jgi:tetratricopeptide (TPR) repeat protein|nr:tetratricopeptide repeat protein [Treponema sp.]
MAEASQKTNIKSDKPKVSDILGDFIQKNRTGIVVCLVLILAGIIGVTAAFTIKAKLQEKALTEVDAFNRRYEALRIYITSEEPDDEPKKAEVGTLLEDLAAFEARTSGFAAARAYALSAGIYGDQKNWAEAEKAWTNAARAAAKTYFEPVCLFNAAAALEEQGSNGAAIELYNQVLAFSGGFPAAARAQFAVGRLQETQGAKDAALEAYRALLSRWPEDPVWANLAQSRIIVLQGQ